MTITSPYSPVSFPGSGTTGPFDVPFRLLDKADVIVQHIAIDGTVTTLSEGIGSTQYQITLLSGGITGARFTLTTALAIGERLVIARRTPRTQRERLANLTRFNPEIHEKAFDKATMLIQENESEASSALKFPQADVPGRNQTLPVDAVRANKVMGFDAQGQPVVSNLTVQALDDFNQAVIDVQAEAAIAVTAAGTATTQAGIATTQANLAIQTVEGIPYRDAIFLTFANSPRTLTNADRGKLFVIDTSGGNFVFNMAQISTLTMPFTVGIKKDTADGNTITVNRAGTDTIDGLTSYTISSVGGANFIADTDPSPDRWVTASFGATGGEVKDQTFLSGTDFTPGVTTTLTLTNTPIAPSSTAVTISFDGIAQHPSEWSYNPANGTTTFTSPIPVGVSQVYFRWAATSTAIGTPNDGTVSWIKLASGLIATFADVLSGAANKLVPAAVAQQMVGHVLLATQTASNSATVDFVNVFNSTYDEYIIEWQDVIPATSGVYHILKVGTGATPTWQTGASYQSTGYTFVAGTTTSGGGAGPYNHMALGGGGKAIDKTVSAAGFQSGTARTKNPLGSTLSKFFEFDCVAGTNSGLGRDLGIGCFNPTTAITSLRFSMSSGNITSGIYRVYGVRK